MGIKQLGQAARVVQCTNHGVDQRQIAQLGKTANFSAAKRFFSSPLFSIDAVFFILASPGLHAQVASYEMMSCLSDEKISPS
jgi:hypothetical protein